MNARGLGLDRVRTFFRQRMGELYPVPGIHLDLNKYSSVRALAYAGLEIRRRMEAGPDGDLPEEASAPIYMQADGAPVNMGIRMGRREKHALRYVRWLLTGVWHNRNEFRLKTALLFFDSFESAFVRRWRGTLGQALWYAFATNPNQFQGERLRAFKGFLFGWVEVAMPELIGRAKAAGKSTVSALDVHEHMLERAAECPLALLAVKWTRYAAIYQMSLDSIRRTERMPYGDFNLYKSFCRFAVGYIYPVTNAFKYVYMLWYQLMQYKIISEREYLIVAKLLFTGRTPNGENCELDIVVENIIGYSTNQLTKHTQVAGSARTRDTIGDLRNLTQARLAELIRPDDDEFRAKPPRAGEVTEHFQHTRRWVHETRIALLGADLRIAKGKQQPVVVPMASFVSPTDRRPLSPLLLCFEDVAAERLEARAHLEVPLASYDKAERPGETKAYPMLPVFADDTERLRGFERMREVTDDLHVIREYKLRGLKGPSLFTKPLLISAIVAARDQLAARPARRSSTSSADATCMTNAQLKAAKRDELCAELCRLRRTHREIVESATARFDSGEGYTTQLPVLEHGLAGFYGPHIKLAGKTYSPLEHELMQLRTMRTRRVRQFNIAYFEPRPAGAAAGAGQATASGAGAPAGGQAPAAGASTQPAGTARELAAAVVARTVGDRSDTARAERASSMADAELSEAADEARARRAQARPAS